MKSGFLLCLLSLLVAATTAPAVSTPTKTLPVVRVNVTSQPYDFVRPWTKKSPYTSRGVGTVLSGKRVLVTGELVADSTFIEIEKPITGEKVAASVVCVDYEANLALLKPSDDKFLDGIKPLELSSAGLGDRLVVWQLESTGELRTTSALLTTVETTRYPVGDTPLLTYRLTSTLQPKENSFTLPLLKNGKLAGLLWSYDSRSQSVAAIPHPVIDHFLKASLKTPYRGFPRAGFSFAPLHDPQLRRYAQGKNGNGGIYISLVQKDWPADKAGLKVGDVMLSIDDYAIDSDGNYNDLAYGKIQMSHLLSTRHFDGDTVKFKVLREGKPQTLEVQLTHQPATEHVIAPYLIDQAPRFAILGGLVLTELSRPLLREWGTEWWKRAPQRFVYYERNQAELFPSGHRRIVILTQVLPSPDTIGYEDLHFLVVTKINGVEIKSIADVMTAMARPADGFHKIEFQEDPKQIFLDARQAKSNEANLMRVYGLPLLSR